MTGAGWTAVAWQQFDRDGQPLTLLPQLVEVAADDARTQQLIAAADDYLEWVAAGCPDVDSDVPPEIRDAAEEIARAKQVIAELDPVVKAWAESQPDAAEVGVKRVVPGAVIALTVTRGKEFNEAAARLDHAEFFKNYDDVMERHAELKKTKEYVREKPGQRWSVSAPKEKEEVAA